VLSVAGHPAFSAARMQLTPLPSRVQRWRRRRASQMTRTRAHTNPGLRRRGRRRRPKRRRPRRRLARRLGPSPLPPCLQPGCARASRPCDGYLPHSLLARKSSWLNLAKPSTVSFDHVPIEVLDLIVSVDSDLVVRARPSRPSFLRATRLTLPPTRQLRDHLALAGTCRFSRACYNDLVWQARTSLLGIERLTERQLTFRSPCPSRRSSSRLSALGPA
jgi:hypothetical protein